MADLNIWGFDPHRRSERGPRANAKYPLGEEGFRLVFDELWDTIEIGSDESLVEQVMTRYGQVRNKPPGRETIDYWLEELLWPLVRLQRYVIETVVEEPGQQGIIFKRALRSLLEESRPQLIQSLGAILNYRGREAVKAYRRELQLGPRSGPATLKALERS